MSDQRGEKWGSRLGVILAVAGSAVGLGNFLRFPGQAAANGGGAFMIPYFVALVLVGIPICWVEWTMGRLAGQRGAHSAPGILGVVGGGRAWRYLGAIGVLIPLVISMYYIIIEAWCLRYCVDYVLGRIDLGTDPTKYAAGAGAYFSGLTGVAADGALFADPFNASLIAVAVCFALNFFFLYRGLSGGIEKLCSLAMPVMAICATLVLARVLTLGTPDPAKPDQNVINGLGFMWNPDLSKLTDFKTWLAASGQIFFTLSVGMGVILNYASYLTDDDDVVLSALTANATNETFEVGFGGMITIPAAFVFLGAAGAAGSTFGLGFNTLPVVFQNMGGPGRLIGATWFFMLFLAAITSSVSLLQPALAFLTEALGVSRRAAWLALVVTVATGAGWVLYWSKDLTALDTMDFWVGTTMLFVLAAIQVIAFGWVMGVDRGFEAAHKGAQMRIPRVFRFIIKYVSPAYLAIVFVGFCFQNLPGYVDALGKNAVARWTIWLLVGLALIILALVRRGEAQWDKGGAA